jgi:hypothetical protein
LVNGIKVDNQMNYNSISRFASLMLILALGACSLPADVDAPMVAMGNFALGHNIVVVKEPYEGEKLFNLGIKIDAYALAVPGVPLVFKPNSFLIINAIVWDDAAGLRLNEEAKQLTIVEGLSGQTLVSSGLTRNKAKQLEVLSDNAAKAIQDWLLEHPEWFEMPTQDTANTDVPTN